MNHFKKSMLAAVFTLSTASVYFAQVTDTVSSERDIEQVVLTGVADIAKDRKTPVAVSTIKEAQIVQKLGNQEFPEILNRTPSVYTTKGGGGFGDGRINIRGFDTNNIAVMINGVPVNDMENGAVYWSNWSGLSDVTSAMQVQRGLGSSKLAIASVGGTINIITRAADKKREGKVMIGVGNDGYHKALFSYNTGKSATGWSSSFLMSRTAGAMYIDGSDFEGYNYYFALGYQPNEKHDLQFTITGAPQWHNQNFTNSIGTYLYYGKDGEPNRKYNSNWGYLDGEQFTTNTNFYSKPIISLNWDWNITPNSKLSTVGYASFGRGGGTGVLGSINGRGVFLSVNSTTGQPYFSTIAGQSTPGLPRTADGLIRWDDIVTWNRGGVVADFGARNTFPAGNLINRSNNGITMRASVNSHDWYGLLSSFNHKINENLNFTVGFDGRYYFGYHPGIITNFLGANGYQERGDLNRPTGYIVTSAQDPRPPVSPFAKAIKDESQIAYRNYNGEVTWYGGFGQLEYSNDRFSAFLQGAVSNQGFQRIDNWIVDGVTKQQGQVVNQKTGFKNLVGYNAKAGANFNIDEQNNVFANIGYYSKQPFLTAVYPSNQQVLNPNLTNEKIFGAELGYGFRAQGFRANLNLYRTSWEDRFQRRTGLTVTDATGKQFPNSYAEVNGIQQVHYGLEVETTYDLNDFLELEGMFSWGDWRYKGNATSQTFDENNNPIQLANGTNATELALDGVKVGDAAQLTAALGLTVKPVQNLRISADWRYIDQLYARFNVNDFDTAGNSASYVAPATQFGALRLPSYNVFDLGASYRIPVGVRESFTIGANVYNLFDTTYISEATSNIHANQTRQNFRTQAQYDAYNAVPTYKGLKTTNTVYFGFGRTWAANVSFTF